MRLQKTLERSLLHEFNTLSKSGTGIVAVAGPVDKPQGRPQFSLRGPVLVGLRTFRTALSAWSPALDLYQNADNIVAVVELPGMRREEIEISLHDGMLTISGERKREASNDAKAERTERYIGKFRRSITLPTRVDANKVSASYRDGILTVTLPKAEEAKPKQIQVKVD
jgi:HSP20 family protein